jgi:hypothetical protein
MASFTAIHPEDFKTPLGDRPDVPIMPDDARVPVAGAAPEDAAVQRRAARPETPIS